MVLRELVGAVEPIEKRASGRATRSRRSNRTRCRAPARAHAGVVVAQRSEVELLHPAARVVHQARSRRAAPTELVDLVVGERRLGCAPWRRWRELGVGVGRRLHRLEAVIRRAAAERVEERRAAFRARPERGEVAIATSAARSSRSTHAFQAREVVDPEGACRAARSGRARSALRGSAACAAAWCSSDRPGRRWCRPRATRTARADLGW